MAASSPSGPPSYYRTSACAYAVWWCMLLALHVANAIYYGGVTMLYHGMRRSNLEFQLSTYSIGISSDEWPKVAIVHFVVGGCHAVCVLNMVVGSVLARRLVFQPPQIRLRLARLEQTRTRTKQTQLRQLLRIVSIQVIRLIRAVFGRAGLLGVDGEYFDHLHLVREIVETALQTLQAYRMSYLLPRAWLNRVFVGLLVANCLSTPVVYRYYSTRHVARRMMSLLSDAILDVVSSIGVSFLILASYAPQYTDPAFGFAMAQWFDDVWFANMQQEFQMMLVVSWADMGSRLVFALGLLQGMDAMKDMLTPPSVTVASLSKGGLAAVPRNAATIVPSPSIHEIPSSHQNHRRSRNFAHFVVHNAGPGLFVVWGLAILVLQGLAEFRPTASLHVPCKLLLRPWFATRPACSLVELDCYRLGGQSGSLESMQTAWNHFEATATARLVLRNCPALVIPPMLHQFTYMTGLKIYNSTILSWADDAALTETHHGRLRVVFLIRTILAGGELPIGLWTTQFPQRVRSVVTSVTNLQTLPPNLHERWSAGMQIVLEFSAITTIPTTLVTLEPYMLSFAGSPLVAVPVALFEIPTLRVLLLSYTHVQELPREVARPPREWYLFFLQGTNVSTFWSWMEPFIAFSSSFRKGFFNAFDTPYCRRLQQRLAEHTTDPLPNKDAQHLASVMHLTTLDELRFAQSAVDCTPGFPFYFPLGLEDLHSGVTT